MATHAMPDDLRRFILTSVPSVPYLEAVLSMRRERSREWNADLLARRLYIGDSAALALLEAAMAGGVVTRDDNGTYRYAPAEALAAMIDRLAQEYSVDLVGVTRLIHSRTDKRAHQFADAFRWRKD